MSTSPIGFLQMTGRIRILESNEIITLIDPTLSITKYAPVYTFDDVKNYFAYIYKGSDFNQKIIKLNDGTKMIVNEVDGLFEQTIMYNHIEELNKHRQYFIPTFIKLCKTKGHTFEPLEMTDKPVEIKKNKIETVQTAIIKIIEADNITSVEADEIVKKKNQEVASENE